MVEAVSIRPCHQVGRVRDYSEAQEVELLHQPQQIVVLPAGVFGLTRQENDTGFSIYYLEFDPLSIICNSIAIWLTCVRAPDFIQSLKPPSEYSASSMSI